MHVNEGTNGGGGGETGLELNMGDYITAMSDAVEQFCRIRLQLWPVALHLTAPT